MVKLREGRSRKDERETVLFAAQMVYKALNPTSKKDVPNIVYIQIEKEYEKWKESKRLL